MSPLRRVPYYVLREEKHLWWWVFGYVGAERRRSCTYRYESSALRTPQDYYGVLVIVGRIIKTQK